MTAYTTHVAAVWLLFEALPQFCKTPCAQMHSDDRSGRLLWATCSMTHPRTCGKAKLTPVSPFCSCSVPSNGLWGRTPQCLWPVSGISSTCQVLPWDLRQTERERERDYTDLNQSINPGRRLVIRGGGDGLAWVGGYSSIPRPLPTYLFIEKEKIQKHKTVVAEKGKNHLL